MLNMKRSWFFYLVAISIGSMSLFTTTSTLLSLELKEAVMFAKTYETQQLDETKVKTEESLEIAKKRIKKYTTIQPVLATGWFEFYIINHGCDIPYIPGQAERSFVVHSDSLIPVGSMAPPYFSVAI